MSWRGLGWFWAIILLLGGAGAATLQALGPLPHATVAVAPIRPPPPAAPRPVARPLPPGDLPQPAQYPGPNPEPLTTVIAAPDIAMLEQSKVYPTELLPKVAPDGRIARLAYARGFDAADKRPRIALIVAGIGTAGVDSRAAIAALPGAVDLAVTPYAPMPEQLAQLARARGHELLISIPMEPAGYPLNDAGTQSLMPMADAGYNARALDWALGRLQGYAGATGALDGMRGERFAEQPDQMRPILDELGRRGLFYVDPRPGAPPLPGGKAPVRDVDLVIDDPPNRAQIDAKLAELERIARDRGVALGLAGPPAATTVERIAAWAQGLETRGIVLAPVSALIPEAPK